MRDLLVRHILCNYLTVRNNIVWGATHGISFRNYDNGSGMVHARWENNTVHGGQTGTNNAFEIDAASSKRGTF